MDLGKRVDELTAGRHPRVPPLSSIETRAARLKLRTRILGAASVAIVIAAGSILFVRSDFGAADLDAGSGGNRGAVVAPEPSEADTSSLCEGVDACGSQEKGLAQAAEWLGGRLDAAGVSYIDAYRPDGGGGHVNKRWGIQIWVLRPIRETPEQEAAKWGYTPLWTGGGVTVFGRAKPDSPTAYFYWRSGGVDTFVELDWAGSVANDVHDLREVFGRIVAEQESRPYPYGQ